MFLVSNLTVSQVGIRLIFPKLSLTPNSPTMLWVKSAQNASLIAKERLIASHVQEVRCREEQIQVAEYHREGTLDQAEACRAYQETEEEHHLRHQERRGHLEEGKGSHQEEEGTEGH